MGPEIIAIIGAVSGIIKLTTAIIEAIQRGGGDLSPEAKEAIRKAHREAMEMTERLSKIPFQKED